MIGFYSHLCCWPPGTQACGNTPEGPSLSLRPPGVASPGSGSPGLWLQVVQPGLEAPGKKENPAVSRTRSFLSSPETLNTLGWKLSRGSLKFKSWSLGNWVWGALSQPRSGGSPTPSRDTAWRHTTHCQDRPTRCVPPSSTLAPQSHSLPFVTPPNLSGLSPSRTAHTPASV